MFVSERERGCVCVKESEREEEGDILERESVCVREREREEEILKREG